MVFASYLENLLYRIFSCQEEVVLKRCWLARYCGLAAKYGKPLSVLTSFFWFFGTWAWLILSESNKGRNFNVVGSILQLGKEFYYLSKLC